jgi:hypothetical protein
MTQAEHVARIGEKRNILLGKQLTNGHLEGIGVDGNTILWHLS